MKRTLRIRTQFFVISAITLLLVSVCFFVYYGLVTRVIEEKNEDYIDQIFEQVMRQVTSNCDLLQKLLINIAYSPTVQAYLLERDPVARFELSSDVLTSLQRTAIFANGIVEIVIVGNHGLSLSVASSGAAFLRHNDITFPEKGQVYFTEMMSFFTGGETENHCILVGMNIFSIELGREFGENLGSAAVFADVAAIGWDTLLSSSESDTAFFLLDRRGNVFASDLPAEIGEPFEIIGDIEITRSGAPQRITSDGRQYIVRAEALPYIEGTIVGFTPLSSLLSEISGIRFMMMIILSIVLILLTGLLMLVARNILNPLGKVTTFINTVKGSDVRNLKERISVDGYAEIVSMAEEFNSMIDRVGELTGRLIEANAKLYRAELLKKQSEMAMLQSQINPHFLYNTLEAVKGMALAAGDTNVVEMTKSLGNIFRFAVRGADIVSLSEELDMLQSYISIQQTRFSNRFRAEYRVDPEVAACPIPKMILQPVVENAVIHGLEMKPGDGLISVRAHADGEGLQIIIQDNGCGMTQAVLTEIRRALESAEVTHVGSLDHHEPIGLKNVQGRIRMLYGDRYGIHIESSEEHGTVVSYLLPLRVSARV